MPDGDALNWIDPDLEAYYEATGDGATPELDAEKEDEFRRFFLEDWETEEFDDIRERWDPLIKDADPHGRVLGKTALWSLVQLRRLRAEHAVNSTMDQQAHEK